MLEFDCQLYFTKIDWYLPQRDKKLHTIKAGIYSLQDENHLNLEDSDSGSGSACTAHSCTDGYEDARGCPTHSYTLCIRKKTAYSNISNSGLKASSNSAYVV